jgi:hypothetical protein
MGIAAVLCTVPGAQSADDKKPAPRPAAATAPAAAPARTAPAAPSRPAATAPAAGASHVPGVSTSHPATTAPAGGVTARPTGASGVPARPTGVGGTPARPAVGGGVPNRPTGVGRVPDRAPVGGTQFGRGAARQPGTVRAPIAHAGHNVYAAPGGRRSYERTLPGGQRVYADGRGRGYIHSEFRYGGHTVYQRVYYVNGRAYPRYYNPYLYHGIEISIYAPPRYYAPGFYGWAYNPWAVPVVYTWGFGASPWYGYYGGYFTPYRSYASPSLWLTDYLIANNLELAYQAQQDAAAQQQLQQQSYAAPLTPDVKAQIADEVKRQIALENSERPAAQSGLPDPVSSGVARMFLDHTTHVFVVAAPLNVDSQNGQCPVTEGDVLQLTPGQSPGADGLANVVVLSSKGQDCQRGSTVLVGVADLQDMQNAMRQTIDQGLATLQQNQGQGGLPPVPASANTPPVEAAYAKIGPPPPADGAQQITQEWNDGSRAEKADPSVSDPGNIAAPVPQPQPVDAQQPEPVQLGPGMTIAEVEASQGKPATILAPSPTKKIYIYKNFKVTFTNGKVTDIQ